MRDLRWYDTVFQGQYLPSLSINYMYVTINKDLEKTASKVVLDKDQNLLRSGWMTSELSKQRNVAINLQYLPAYKNLFFQI